MSTKNIPLKNKNGIIVEYGIVDEINFDKVSRHKWHRNSKGYVTSAIVGLMHRFLMNAKKGDPMIDHKNNNRLDNRIINLRVATRPQNSQNREKKKNCTSIYIGVCFKHKKWTGSINKISCTFDLEINAAYWYDQMALKIYGPDAKINKVLCPENYVEPVLQKKISKLGLPRNISNRGGTFQVIISNNKIVHYVGTIQTVEEAIQIRDKMLEEFKQLKIKEENAKEIIRNKNGLAIVKATGDIEVIIDDDMYHDLAKRSLYPSGDGYISLNINGKSTLIHRYIMNAKEEDPMIDHIDNNKLDNRRCNLRPSNDSLNSHNRKKLENTSSKYIGVSYDNETKKFRAYIKKDRKMYYIGRYKTQEEAAIVRDKKAIELYGSYAKLNFPINT
jgi:hypothetical protein